MRETQGMYNHKDFGNWKIKTDVYVAGLWFLVQFGAECDSYIHWVVSECIMFSVMVASYERDEPWVLKQFISKLYANGTRYFYF